MKRNPAERVPTPGKRHRMKPGTLLLIEKGDDHMIPNDSRGLLGTPNFYVPPAYDADGDELPRGRR